MSQHRLTLAFGTGAGFVFIETALGTTVKDVKASGATVTAIEIDNRTGPAMVYLKGWFAASGTVTLGTTPPNLVLPAPAGKKVTYLFTANAGWPTALSVACVTQGGTPGTTGPTNSVSVKIAYS